MSCKLSEYSECANTENQTIEYLILQLIMGKKKPIPLYLLITLLMINSISALYGGIGLVINPTGSSLKLGNELLAGTIFNNYLIPGIILLLVFGAFPLFLIYTLLREPQWNWTSRINMYRNRYWAWSYSLITGIALIGSMFVKIFMVGYEKDIKIHFALLGVAIVVFTLWPSVMKYYRRSPRKSKYKDEWSLGGQEQSLKGNQH
jgi:hypothetical protein